MSKLPDRSMTRWAVAAAAAIFLVNVMFAWVIIYRAHEFIARDLLGNGLAEDSSPRSTATREVFSRLRGARNNEIVVLADAMRADVHLKSVANVHLILVVASSAGLSLMAIGFALFVMGAEGGFEIEASNPSEGKAVLRSAAPGILCFLLGSLLIGGAMYRKTRIEFGKSTFSGIDARPMEPLAGGVAASALPAPDPIVVPSLGIGLEDNRDPEEQRR